MESDESKNTCFCLKLLPGHRKVESKETQFRAACDLEFGKAALFRNPWILLLETTRGTPGETGKAEGSWNSSVISSQSLVLVAQSEDLFCL